MSDSLCISINMWAHVVSFLLYLQLFKAHEELNKKIYEHDKDVATGAVKVEVTLAVSALMCSLTYFSFPCAGVLHVYFVPGECPFRGHSFHLLCKPITPHGLL